MTCDCSDRGTCLTANGACDCDPGWSGTRCETSKQWMFDLLIITRNNCLLGSSLGGSTLS